MNWDDIKIFLALMRAGSVRAAAEKLGISHSTVARRIEAMEQKLAVRLFDRLPSGYVVTTIGEDMLKVAEQVETDLGGLERRILGHDHKLAGRITVTMVDALATGLLMPHLTEFTEKYSEIELEIDVTYDTANLSNREADVAIRFSQHPPELLIGRRLLTCATAAYASQEYIDRHDLDDPAKSRWIGFGAHDWVKKSAFPTLPVKGTFVSLMVQLEACRHGMGMGMLPCFLGDPEPALRRLSPPLQNPNFDLWLLTHPDTRTNARIRAFKDFIAEAIISHRPLLEGQG
ncbi:MAG: LysR family transcriptional regulator [Alphaproteobacteria bacterium]|nr:MAG: LysR family transcriptional regulator [Alphaproteobacteria bacterium]